MATATYLNDAGDFWFQKRPRHNRGDRRFYDVFRGGARAQNGDNPLGSVFFAFGAWRIEGDSTLDPSFASRVAAARELVRRKSIQRIVDTPMTA